MSVGTQHTLWLLRLVWCFLCSYFDCLELVPYQKALMEDHWDKGEGQLGMRVRTAQAGSGVCPEGLSSVDVQSKVRDEKAAIKREARAGRWGCQMSHLDLWELAWGLLQGDNQ